MTDILERDNCSEQDDHDDIYRGGGPPPLRPASVRSVSSHAETVSSSSSSSSIFGIGALASVVENAISRWAKKNGSDSDSSSSTSSTSVSSSVITLSRSRTARRRRRASIRSAASERDIAARIRARQESRLAPRSFTLYLPPTIAPGSIPLNDVGDSFDKDSILHTTSLPLVTSQLEAALRRSAKAQRTQNKARTRKGAPAGPSRNHHDYMLPESIRAPSRPASFTDLTALRNGKGKQKEVPLRAGSLWDAEVRKQSRAWWLDVASPSWTDMRAIGKLLHLHPLTLEDILQQEPREKLELFDRLGYYFIVLRAIETTSQRQHPPLGNDSHHETDFFEREGALGESNVYLVVFREGICTFHFTDISDHTERVRNRMSMLKDSFNMSADWISHGLFDSVVDSFFPILRDVEKEVMAVEALVFSPPNGVESAVQTRSYPNTVPSTQAEMLEKQANEDGSISSHLEKPLPVSLRKPRTRFFLPRFTWPLFLRRVKRKITAFRLPLFSAHDARPETSQTHTALRRMARTRRLVTSLSRLLAAKSEVLTQIRKRLLSSGQVGLARVTNHDEDVEISIYMGDIQDHILTLQHSLFHYERMLSQSHPAHLSQLRTAVSLAKNGSDKAIFALTVISLGVVLSQTVIGIFSMNVHILANSIDPPGPYYVFGIVISACFVAECAFIFIIRFWWIKAKRHRAMRQQAL
ncbi:hypothetical protein CONPUDRAFT_79000 [Coniophora puteana RWD-64-598 SS2]|uniref:Cora-domain-containing protein n=1 Tax=Coniophora puteana (strain RWD-64-598) TaxID=741705 RepID=A0A5M3N5R9_CONPW|nr:uncharacterized protein CONPUDRAFT_79000 [Coniophora puteana RWD-64-598 SS2]EIW86760.1 hypothetical protein CONPUDRAFT_79000 [Coniophora puteana RWD-64-598 SS2]